MYASSSTRIELTCQYTVDAFTAEPFAGNQAAVIVFPAGTPWPDDAFLVKVAAEFNYAETAYIVKVNDSKPNEYGLRWFTPMKEVRYPLPFRVCCSFYLSVLMRQTLWPCHARLGSRSQIAS